MNQFTEEEIKLCRQLYDLDVRPPIREGDWILDDKNIPRLVVGQTVPEGNIVTLAWDKEKAGEVISERLVLLWSWERCREYLRERGWKLQHAMDDGAGQVVLEFWKFLTFGGPLRIRWASQTDLEAILKVCVQVAEEEEAWANSTK